MRKIWLYHLYKLIFVVLIFHGWSAVAFSKNESIQVTIRQGEEDRPIFVTKSVFTSNNSDSSTQTSEETADALTNSTSHEEQKILQISSERPKTEAESYEEIVKNIEDKHSKLGPATLMEPGAEGDSNDEDLNDSQAVEETPPAPGAVQEAINNVSKVTSAVSQNLTDSIKSTMNKVSEAFRNATHMISTTIQQKGKRSARSVLMQRPYPILFSEVETGVSPGPESDASATENDVTEAEDSIEMSTIAENLDEEGGVIGHGTVDEVEPEPEPKSPKETASKVPIQVTGKQELKDSKGNGAVDSAISSAAAYPAFPIKRKPGTCRPLTKGLACIALARDASQCSTDNGCPGTKKCCFYGCPPYTNIGICEFPVLDQY